MQNMAIVNYGRRIRSMDSAIFNDLWMVPFSMTLSDLARHRATAELLVAKHLSYIGHAHEKTTQRD